MTLRTEIADALRFGGLDPAEVERVIRRALDEDLAFGPDVTTDSTVAATATSTGEVVPRSAGVLAGVPVAAAVFDLVGGAAVDVVLHAADGSAAEPDRAVLTVGGPTRALLTAERTALNLIGRLSGVATLTRRWVDAVAGTGAEIRDTRKTTPGLRALEKYAVRCGGGTNHRMGLGDAALIKDNHVAAAGGLTAAVEAVRAHAPGIPLEVECDTLDQVKEALAAGVGLVLLDNFDLAGTRAAVEMVAGSGMRLEASGGLDLPRAAEVAATGVDYLAVGALTHSAPVLDLGFDLRA
jgi:nicotinate-nucleotide pyrophosphorylase (carboxylating)